MRLKDPRLLPCPFCGGKAVLRVIPEDDPDWDNNFEDVFLEDDTEDSPQYRPECWQCEVGFSKARTFYTEQQAIEAWNRRA